ncbi:MAG: Type 1 glutamine amidotransferase-like domain-containing protein [Bacillota bacterium]|nr:Type 1 glutamine amidotransferase-like domain-containing protein [Bacillota bacterium]
MNVLLNINNFSEPFAYSVLKDIIKKNMRVLIIPFSYHEDWIKNAKDFDQHYQRGKDEYEDIAKEFVNYGIPKRHIKVLHYYKYSNKKCKSMIYNADILFLIGGYPDKLLYRIDQKNIRKSIQNFRGIVMGTSAGAMVQFDHYHVTPEEEGQEYEYHDGLGLLSGFDIEVHYEETFNHLAGVLIDLKLHNVPIFALPNTGGMIIDRDDYCLLGDAFEIGEKDIDFLQEKINKIVEK